MSAAASGGMLPAPAARDPVLAAGIARGRALFNRADYWGSHEALEAAWRVAPVAEREALQGLIQSGAAFHKLVVQDNPAGARRLLGWALAKLDGLPDGTYGLALDPFRTQLNQWAERLALAPRLEGSIVGLPRLELSPAARSACIEVDSVQLYEVLAGDRRALLVAVEAEGCVGWGECRMSWESHGLWNTLSRTLVAALLTEPVAAPSELPVIWSGLAANPCATAGVEAAMWDLWARRAGLPLVAALGVSPRPVPLLGRVHGAVPDQLRASLAARLAAGYRHLSLPARPNADRRLLPQLVAGCGASFAIDLGAAYRPADIKALQVLDGLGATWLSQPVPSWNLAEAITLARWLATPVSLGGWVCEEQARGALALKAADILHVDPGVCGLTEALRIAELAEIGGQPLGVAGSAATAVGAAADLALAAHAGATLPADIGPAAAVTDEPGGGGGAAAEGWPGRGPDDQGRAQGPDGPGLGVVPTQAWLDRVTLRHAVFRA